MHQEIIMSEKLKVFGTWIRLLRALLHDRFCRNFPCEFGGVNWLQSTCQGVNKTTNKRVTSSGCVDGSYFDGRIGIERIIV